MTVVAIDAGEGAIERAFDIGGVADDVGRLTAELECDWFEIPPGGSCDRATGAGAAGETDHVDTGMVDQCITGDLTAAVDQIHHARWQPGFVEDLDHAQHRERCVFRGLQHAGITEGNASCDSHRGERERGIPRGDAACDTTRLAGDVSDVAFALRVGLTVGGACDLGEELEVARHAIDMPTHADER